MSTFIANLYYYVDYQDRTLNRIGKQYQDSRVPEELVDKKKYFWRVWKWGKGESFKLLEFAH